MACVPRLPDTPVERALVRDMVRVVDVKSQVGWLVDELEMDAALTNALKSTCQVPEASVARSLAWVDRTIAAEGGDVAAVWRQRGRDLGEVDELLMWTRVRLLLARSAEWAREGRCPFWLEPSASFSGVHHSANRWVLSLEGGGRFIEEFALGEVRYGGGGSGRLLVGRAFTDTWTVSLGGEFGGDARFTNLQIGQVQELPQLVAFIATPVVLRYDFGTSTYAELETGALFYIDRATADQFSGTVSANSQLGIRAGVAVGASYLRIQQGIMPKFTFAFTFEHIPAATMGHAITQIGVGARTGFDFTFWTEH
jgi:hypothetical protein